MAGASAASSSSLLVEGSDAFDGNVIVPGGIGGRGRVNAGRECRSGSTRDDGLLGVGSDEA